MEKYKVLDDFLPQDMFNEMAKFITSPGSFPLYYHDCIVSDSNRYKEFYFVHHLYYDSLPRSECYTPIVEPFIERLAIHSVIRAKVNAVLRTETIVEHDQHCDFDIPHNTVIFYLNSNDGFTRLEDGTKINSVANRILLLDGSVKHNSTSCTDQDLRFVLNLNFI